MHMSIYIYTHVYTCIYKSVSLKPTCVLSTGMRAYTIHCNTLCVAVCVAVCCNMLHCDMCNTIKDISHCNTLQHTSLSFHLERGLKLRSVDVKAPQSPCIYINDRSFLQKSPMKKTIFCQRDL